MGLGGVVTVAVVWSGRGTTVPQVLGVTGGRPKLSLQLGRRTRWVQPVLPVRWFQLWGFPRMLPGSGEFLQPVVVLRGEEEVLTLLLFLPNQRYFRNRWGTGTYLPKTRAVIIPWGGTTWTLRLIARRMTVRGTPAHLRPVVAGGERGRRPRQMFQT